MGGVVAHRIGICVPHFFLFYEVRERKRKRDP